MKELPNTLFNFKIEVWYVQEISGKNETFNIHKWTESERGTYSVGLGIRFSKKCSLSEIADIEGIQVLENVHIVLILMLENWTKKYEKNE